LLFLSGCASSQPYRIQKVTIDEARDIRGYVVVKNEAIWDKYTLDDKGTLPDNAGLAEQRFARRKEFVTEWYKKYSKFETVPRTPEYQEKMGQVTSIFLFPVYPIVLWNEADEYRLEKNRPDYHEKETAYAELKKYIEEDMEKEKEWLKSGN
jgi:hypothetical protein